MRSFEKPSDRDYRSLRNFICEIRPLASGDTEAFLHKNDIVALRPLKEPSWLEQIVEFVLYRLGLNFAKVPPSSEHVHYYNSKIVSGIATTIIVLAMAILLVAPITICYFLITRLDNDSAYGGCIGVLLGFTILFTVSMILVSNAKRHEIVAATTAYATTPTNPNLADLHYHRYCAILVVFLGNAGNSNGIGK